MAMPLQGKPPTVSVPVPVPVPVPRPLPLRDRDVSDPERRGVELVGRGRVILAVSAADLEAAEGAYGPFHPTAWHFRNALNEARRSWDRLRAEFGSAALDAALEELPLTMLVLGDDVEPDGYRDRIRPGNGVGPAP